MHISRPLVFEWSPHWVLFLNELSVKNPLVSFLRSFLCVCVCNTSVPARIKRQIKSDDPNFNWEPNWELPSKHTNHSWSCLATKIMHLHVTSLVLTSAWLHRLSSSTEQSSSSHLMRRHKRRRRRQKVTKMDRVRTWRETHIYTLAFDPY